MLENEKYKGNALLQTESLYRGFSYQKASTEQGDAPMFYVEDDYNAIISKRM